jgi:hypothetical protein
MPPLFDSGWSRVTTGRTYGLVYLVYNTIGNLLTQNDQVRCFENAARHLTDDGVFVLECRVPTAPARPGHQFIDVERLEVDHIGLDVCRYDPVTQILDENHVHIGADGFTFSPIRLRLAYPPEFDLMARIAALDCEPTIHPAIRWPTRLGYHQHQHRPGQHSERGNGTARHGPCRSNKPASATRTDRPEPGRSASPATPWVL